MTKNFIQTLPKKLQDSYLFDYMPKADVTQSYFFCGKSRTGKTVSSLLFAKKYENSLPVSIDSRNVIKYLHTLTFNETACLAKIGKDSEGWEARQSLKFYGEVPLLILDDLGVVKASEHVNEYMYALLEARWNNGGTTYFTSEKTIQELASQYQSNISTRIEDIICGNVIELQSNNWLTGIKKIPAPIETLEEIFEERFESAFDLVGRTSQKQAESILAGIKKTNTRLAEKVQNKISEGLTIQEAIFASLGRKFKAS